MPSTINFGFFHWQISKALSALKSNRLIWINEPLTYYPNKLFQDNKPNIFRRERLFHRDGFCRNNYLTGLMGCVFLYKVHVGEI